MVSKNNVLGVVDDKHNILIPLEYKSLYYISEDFFAISHDGEKWGVIDKNGKVILKHEYDAIDGSITNGNLAIKIKENIKEEIKENVEHRIIHAKQYRYIDTIHLNGYFFNKDGLLKKKPLSLIHLKSSRYYYGYAYYSNRRSDLNGFTISPYSLYHERSAKKESQLQKNKGSNHPFKIKTIIDESVVVWEEHRQFETIIHYTYLKGIKNAKNELVIPLIYREIESTRLYDEKNKYLYPQNFIPQDLNIFLVKRGHKYGMIDINHKMILNIEYDNIEIIGGRIIVTSREGDILQKSAIFDFTGKMIESFK